MRPVPLPPLLPPQAPLQAETRSCANGQSCSNHPAIFTVAAAVAAVSLTTAFLSACLRSAKSWRCSAGPNQKYHRASQEDFKATDASFAVIPVPVAAEPLASAVRKEPQSVCAPLGVRHTPAPVQRPIEVPESATALASTKDELLELPSGPLGAPTGQPAADMVLLPFVDSPSIPAATSDLSSSLQDEAVKVTLNTLNEEPPSTKQLAAITMQILASKELEGADQGDQAPDCEVYSL